MNLVHDLHMNHLPPFDALIAFEACIRTGGMTPAAEELGVTQSAVSHRIRRLEAFMGVPLLVRKKPGLAPTSAGQALLRDLSGLMDGMADLRRRCRAAATSSRLRVGVGAALADNWLVRRLPDFSAQYPDVVIELAVVENEAPERLTDTDIRILWVGVEQAKASSTQRPLFREHVFPVCHPSLVPEARSAGDASVLSCLPLLHKHTPGYEAGEEWSWDHWFCRLGLNERPKEAMRFASIGPAITAALHGNGAVLARSMLVHDALLDGRLVRVLPEMHDRLSGKVHVVRWPARLCGDERVRRFVSWLAENAAAVRREKQDGQPDI